MFLPNNFSFPFFLWIFFVSFWKMPGELMLLKQHHFHPQQEEWATQISPRQWEADTQLHPTDPKCLWSLCHDDAAWSLSMLCGASWWGTVKLIILYMASAVFQRRVTHTHLHARTHARTCTHVCISVLFHRMLSWVGHFKWSLISKAFSCSLF